MIRKRKIRYDVIWITVAFQTVVLTLGMAYIEWRDDSHPGFPGLMYGLNKGAIGSLLCGSLMLATFWALHFRHGKLCVIIVGAAFWVLLLIYARR